MLRTSIIKKNTEKIIASLKKKNFDAEKIIKEIIEIDNLRIKIQKELNRLQNQMNSLSKEIGICFTENNKEKAENLKSESGNLKNLIQVKNDEQKKSNK